LIIIKLSHFLTIKFHPTMRHFLLLGLLTLSGNALFAQSTSAGFDAAYAQKLQAALNSTGTSNGYKGLSAAVFVPGHGQWIGTFGNSQPGQPIAPNMRFCIASNSKLVTAVLCLRLQDEGLLSLEDSVGKWLPPFANVDPTITIHQLLSHQSGLFDFYNDATSATLGVYNSNPDSLWTPEAVLSTIGAPWFAPGEGYIYSNTNTLVAAMCCAAAADTSIGFLLRDRIFEPLGLSQTTYPADGSPVFDQPWARLLNNSNALLLDPLHANGFNSFIQTAGGVWSTAADLMTWYRAVFAGDFLSASAQAQLRAVEPWSNYSLGLRAQNRFGATLRYHGGAWGYRSFCGFDEKTGITVTLLSNLQGKSVTTAAEKLLETALEELPQKPVNLTLSAILTPLNGSICAPFDSVRVLVKNTGAQAVSQMTFEQIYNGFTLGVSDFDFVPALQPGESRAVAPVESIFPGGVNELTVRIGAAGDGYDFDNARTNVLVQHSSGSGTMPFAETFDYQNGALPPGWTSHQPENVLDWGCSAFAGAGGALCRNNFDDGNLDAEYLLDLPTQPIGGPDASFLNFDYAYAPYPGFAEDTLEVLISYDCGQNFESIWKKGGAELATAEATTASFLPAAADWETVHFQDFDDFGVDAVLRFRVLNRFGNNIWLDNVHIGILVGTTAPPSQAFTLAPNPVRTRATLSLTAPVRDATLSFFNAFGQKMWEKTGLSGQTFDIERGILPAGLYFFDLQENGRTALGGKVWMMD
jgi:D-alanyl-D-alanine carboxypeptidase